MKKGRRCFCKYFAASQQTNMKNEIRTFLGYLNDAVCYLCLILLGIFVGLLFLLDNSDLAAGK